MKYIIFRLSSHEWLSNIGSTNGVSLGRDSPLLVQPITEHKNNGYSMSTGVARDPLLLIRHLLADNVKFINHVEAFSRRYLQMEYYSQLKWISHFFPRSLSSQTDDLFKACRGPAPW